MKHLSSRVAKKAIADTYDLIDEMKGVNRLALEKNRRHKNMLYQQIENRKTIIKSLEKFVNETNKLDNDTVVPGNTNSGSGVVLQDK